MGSSVVSSPKRWLKWTLIGVAAIAAAIILLAAAALYLLTRPAQPSGVEALSPNWVLHRYNAGNPDGKASDYLARRSAGMEREISWKVFEARYVEDDCVVYSDWNDHVYGVCGDRAPVYVGLRGERDHLGLRSDPVAIDGAHVTIAEIKQAAQSVSEQQPGGRWRAQRRAFAYYGDAGPYWVLMRDEPLHHQRLIADGVTAYRYLGRDCLLWVDRAPDARDYPVRAACGKRFPVSIGTVARPEDIGFTTGPVIEGRTKDVSEIVTKAMSEREIY